MTTPEPHVSPTPHSVCSSFANASTRSAGAPLPATCDSTATAICRRREGAPSRGREKGGGARGIRGQPRGRGGAEERAWKPCASEPPQLSAGNLQGKREARGQHAEVARVRAAGAGGARVQRRTAAR